jgi:hypothetical protein
MGSNFAGAGVGEWVGRGGQNPNTEIDYEWQSCRLMLVLCVFLQKANLNIGKSRKTASAGLLSSSDTTSRLRVCIRVRDPDGPGPPSRCCD